MRSLGALLARKRRRALHNARLAGVEDDRGFHGRASGELGRTTFELIWLLGNLERPLLEGVEIEGLDCVREAVAEGRGVLLASGHFATWDFVGPAAAMSGTPVAGTARAWRSPRLEKRLVAQREACGVKTLFRGESGTGVAAFRWLKEGKIYCCMMDRISSGRRIMIPFLGEGLYVPTGPAEMALRCRSAVVIGFADRRPDGTSCVRFRRLSLDDGISPESLAFRIGLEVERQMRAHPEQWFWIFRRNPLWPGGKGAPSAEEFEISVAGSS
jgi:KDO2-lipid IV(A) lauroyltransferase